MLGTERSMRLNRVNGDPSCTYGGQPKHETNDENIVLIKLSERDAGESEKTARETGNERDLPTVRIVRRNIRVDIRVLA